MASKRAFFGLVLAVLVAGCLPANPFAPPPTPTTAPTSTPTLTPSPVPTATPSPTPTLTPTPLPATRLAQADTLLLDGDYEGAAKAYQAVLDASPDQENAAAAQVGLGRLRYLRGDYPGAIDTLHKVIETYPDAPARASAHYYLGQVYTALHRDTDAATAYADYLQLKPEPLASYIQELRGDSLTAAKDLAGANAAYTAASAAPHLGDSTGLDFKLARNLLDAGEYQAAIERFNAIYTTSDNDYLKADVDLLTGQAYLALNNPEAAQERYMDAIVNFPRSSSAYAALLALVEDGVGVNDLYRGMIDYFAGQYAVAVAALDRYIASNGEQMGTALHYKALTMMATEQYSLAVAAWDQLIQDYPDDRFWIDAWEGKAELLWTELDDYSAAAQTLLDLVAASPAHPRASAELFEAGRILERDDQLEQAAGVWERLGSEYPAAEETFRGLFFAGVARYRLLDYEGAKRDFQRGLLLSELPEDQAAAYLWIGKVQEAQHDPVAAKGSWQQAQGLDPTGYYSERARDLLGERQPFSRPDQLDLGYDPQQERREAETWLKQSFNLPPDTDLSGLGPLAADPRFQRGQEFWSLGLYNEARAEFEDLRLEIARDPAATFRLANYLQSIGMYRPAIMAARQVLSLAGMDDAGSFNAPAYFTHFRFGRYYKDLLFADAQEAGVDPLLVYALMRQESLFEGFVNSSAGARGLMQIVPATADWVVSSIGWPPNYSSEDLYRPQVSIRLGTRYLANQITYFDGDVFAALAAYNAGPGNASIWQELSGGDPDLFLEVVRIQETRTYIMRVYENYAIYRRLYSR